MKKRDKQSKEIRNEMMAERYRTLVSSGMRYGKATEMVAREFYVNPLTVYKNVETKKIREEVKNGQPVDDRGDLL